MNTKIKTETKVLISGFGGQGVMRLGKILAQSAIREKKYTTCFPSYGAEMRGGTAHCFVKVSNRKISSPFIDIPDISIILNQPSLDRFKDKIIKNSWAIINSDLVSKQTLLSSVVKFSLPFNKIALDCGNIKTANIVALGVLISVTKNFLKKETVVNILKEIFDQSNREQNLRALCKGEQMVYREKPIVLCSKS